MLELMSHSVFLWPVAFCGLLSLGISLERFYFLYFRASIAAEPFIAAIQKCVMAGAIDRAIKLCSADPHAPLAKVVKAALVHSGSDRDQLELAVEQATLDAVPAVQQRTGYLAAIANVVTLFGLLGTIVGLIQSFDAVSRADLDERQSLLAGGIAMAMYTTAGGISIAIPTLAFYAILAAKGNAILDDVDRCAARVLLLLRAREAGGGEEAVAQESA